MPEIAIENYSQLIDALSEAQKLRFYEAFAFELTIASRLWSDPNLDNTDIIDQLKWINEIQHRVIAKIRNIRSSTDSWSEEQMISMVSGYVKQNLGIRSAVAYAIKNGYGLATES